MGEGTEGGRERWSDGVQRLSTKDRTHGGRICMNTKRNKREAILSIQTLLMERASTTRRLIFHNKSRSTEEKDLLCLVESPPGHPVHKCPPNGEIRPRDEFLEFKRFLKSEKEKNEMEILSLCWLA